MTEVPSQASQNMTPSITASRSATNITAKRLATIEKLLLQSLDEPDPLNAAFGAANADLFEAAFQIKQSISAALAQTPDLLRALPNLLPAMDMFLKLTRQAERIAKIPKQRIEPCGGAQAPPPS